MLKHTLTTILLFSGICCTLTMRAQDSTEIKQNNLKLARFFIREIADRDEIPGYILLHGARIAMIGIHVNKMQKIDSVSVQCSDSVVVASIKNMRYDQLAMNWLCLHPATAAKTLRSQNVTFYIPLFLTDAWNVPGKLVFSKNDIDAILGTRNLEAPRMHYLQNSILLKPIEIGFSEPKI